MTNQVRYCAKDDKVHEDEKVCYRYRSVIYYNSLSHSRQEVVRLHVTDYNVEVKDAQGKVIQTQIDPFWDEKAKISSTAYKVIIEIDVETEQPQYILHSF